MLYLISAGVLLVGFGVLVMSLIKCIAKFENEEKTFKSIDSYKNFSELKQSALEDERILRSFSGGNISGGETFNNTYNNYGLNGD